MPDRVLVTGATGFVGSHIAQAFVEAGYEVRSARAPPATSVGSPPRHRARAAGSGWERGGPEPGRAERGRRRSRSGDNEGEATGGLLLVNAGGTRSVATAALRAGVRRLVLISSLAARGPTARPPRERLRPEQARGREPLRFERPDGGRSPPPGGRLRSPRHRPPAPVQDGARRLADRPLGRGSLATRLRPGRGPRRSRCGARAVGFGPFPVAENRRYTWRDVAAGLEKRSGVRSAPYACPLAPSCSRDGGRVGGETFSAVPILDERGSRDLALNAWTCDVSGPRRRSGGGRSSSVRGPGAPPGGTGRWGGLV